MRYGISAAALIVQGQQVLLVNQRAAGRYDSPTFSGTFPLAHRVPEADSWWRLVSSPRATCSISTPGQRSSRDNSVST